MDEKAQLRTELSQQGHIATAAMAKNKIRPHTNALDAVKLARERADKCLPGLMAEIRVERNQQQRLRAEPPYGPDFLLQGVNERWHVCRSHDAVRVAVERDDHRGAIVLPGVGNGLANDLLVAKLNAVEEPDRETDFPPALEFSW